MWRQRTSQHPLGITSILDDEVLHPVTTFSADADSSSVMRRILWSDTESGGLSVDGRVTCLTDVCV